MAAAKNAKKNTGKKAAVKKEAPKKAVKKNAQGHKEGTVRYLVEETFKKSPTVTVERMAEIVHKAFPKSKFNKAHFAWYKSHLPAELKAKVQTPRKPRAKKEKTA